MKCSFDKYTKGDTTIFHGDCLEVLPSLPDNSIDLVCPLLLEKKKKKFRNFKDSWPSEKDYTEWCFKWLEICIQKLKSSGSLYVMASTQAMPYLDLWLRNRLTILSRIVGHYD